MKKKKTIISTLTRRSFRQNKGRNLVAAAAIILTAMMFTTLLTLTQSQAQNMTEMSLRQSGTKSHASTKQISENQIEKIASHPDIVSHGESLVAGLAENEGLAGRQVEIRYATPQYAKDAFAYPTTGAMPANADEIALDTITLQRLGIPAELGQKVSLKWVSESPNVSESSDGSESSEVPVSTNASEAPELITSEFTLCGWWEGNLSSYASMAWVSEDFAREAFGNPSESVQEKDADIWMMAVNFSDTKHIDEKIGTILSDTGLTDLEFNANLAYTQEMQSMIFSENLPVYGGMLLVFLAGYLIIFNVFQISIASDIQFYGKLKTLGMTAKQLRKIIRGHANLLSLISIPAGLILGYILGILLVPALLYNVGAKPQASADPLIFIGSAVFAYITVMISCLLPARAAAKVSPMEALRYTDAEPGMKRKTKKSKNGASVSKMAWANLWRNKKRTILVLCSLTLGLVLMSFFYAKNTSFDVEKYLMDLTIADYQIDDATNSLPSGYDQESSTISEELQNDILALKNVEETARLYSHQIDYSFSSTTCENMVSYYTEDRLEEFASYDPTFPLWKEIFDSATAGNPVPITVYGADSLLVKAAASSSYLLNGTFDEEKFSTGDYAIAIGPTVEPGQDLPVYSVGETVSVEGREFTVMAVVSPLMPITSGFGPVFDIPLIIPADTFLSLWPDSNVRKFYLNVGDDTMEEAATLLEDYKNTSAPDMNITSRKTMVEQYEAQTRAASVMGYAISLIIALVGVINFVNSMVTAIISRKREFAMIQSIGMTKRQLRQMLTFEGLYYAGGSLAVSYLLSAFTVGVVVRAIASDGFSTFHFTLLPLMVCTPVLLIFAVVIPYLCFKNLEKQSIVERLRAID
ncbi:ABC transporter permease [Blautia schinkii]|nr:ABC transporter permease [Blautia schinkii]